MGLYGNELLKESFDIRSNSEMYTTLTEAMKNDMVTSLESYTRKIKGLFDRIFISEKYNNRVTCEAQKDDTLYSFDIVNESGLSIEGYNELDINKIDIPEKAIKYAIENCDSQYKLKITKDNIFVKNTKIDKTDKDLDNDLVRVSLSEGAHAHCTTSGVIYEIK